MLSKKLRVDRYSISMGWMWFRSEYGGGLLTAKGNDAPLREQTPVPVLESPS